MKLTIIYLLFFSSLFSAAISQDRAHFYHQLAIAPNEALNLIAEVRVPIKKPQLKNNKIYLSLGNLDLQRSRAYKIETIEKCPKPTNIRRANFANKVLVCMTKKQVDNSASSTWRKSYLETRDEYNNQTYIFRQYYAKGTEWPKQITFRDGKVIDFF